MKTPFLTCHWENLVYINYEIEPDLIIPYLPNDVIPSKINGKTILSIVCFEFSKARFFGIKIPFHQCFPEVNIRVYVQKKDDPSIQGVYFISEMVPKLMTVFVAKYIFGEPFSLKKMELNKTNNSVEYKTKSNNFEMKVKATFAEQFPKILTEHESFIIEKEYAFCGKAGKNSKLFRVEHQKWNWCPIEHSKFEIKKADHLPTSFQIFLLTKNL